MAEDKAVKKEAAKAATSHTVAVTGFYACGKMFRSGQKIDAKQYKDHIAKWLKEGKIK